MTDQFTLAESAAQFVLQRTPLRPRIGLVLGSGLGSFADSLSEASKIPFHEIPSFSRSTAIGHAGQMVIGKAGGVPVAVMQGRVHLYEGYSAEQVAFPNPVKFGDDFELDPRAYELRRAGRPLKLERIPMELTCPQ